MQMLLAVILGLSLQPKLGNEIVLPVELRPGVSANLVATVFHNSHRCNPQDDIVAVPGLVHTAATFGPLAGEFFTGRHQSNPCHVIAIDMPGYGKSEVPAGIVYGTLTLEDFEAALIGALVDLKQQHIQVANLVGHSQGGLLIQMVQSSLLDKGTTLRWKFGVKHVLLLSPVPASPVPWAFTETAQQQLGAFIADDPQLGPVLYIPPQYFAPVFASNLSGQIAPTAPTVEEVVEEGYTSPDPLYAGLELIGVAPFSRPSVKQYSFFWGFGTQLTILGVEQDTFMSSTELQELAQYLTGWSKIALATGEFAVHDLYLADPAALLTVLDWRK